MENNNNKVEWKRLISHFYMKKTISMFLLELNKSSHWERTSFHSLLFLAQITWRVRRYLILIVSRLFEMKRRDVWRQSISRLCIICQPHSSTDRRLTSYAGISLSDLRWEVKREIHANFKRNKASPFSPRLMQLLSEKRLATWLAKGAECKVTRESRDANLSGPCRIFCVQMIVKLPAP